jgi:hypothetical protein
MNGTRKWAGIALAVALCLMLGSSSGLRAQAPAAAGQDAAPKYTLVEYNAYKACEGEANPAAKVKCLDDFVAKYPSSALLNFVYVQYSIAYSQQKNYLKMIDTADKLAALGDKVDAYTRFQAHLSHVVTYYQMLADPQNKGKGLQNDASLAKSTIAAAQEALKLLPDIKKPEGVTDDVWNKQKAQWPITINDIAGQAAMNAKDCSAGTNFYKAELALNPDNAVASYQLGRAFYCMTPPQNMDAFWYMARAVTSKGATQAQSDQVKKFLKGLIANYQGGNVCDSLIDGEMNELLQLAGSSGDRPSSYSLPGAADISAVQKDMTIASVFADLKAGGDKSKLTWLAACGLEFPEVPGKVIEVAAGDPLVLKIAFVTSDAEFDAATTANMGVKVLGQPEAARVEKDSAVHFTGTLVAYDPGPTFFLHWDKAKVKAEDIPKEKGSKKPPVRRPARKPSGRSN